VPARLRDRTNSIAAISHVIERAGWRLCLLDDALALSPKTREELINVALRAARGTTLQLTRRSRHATTYLARIAAQPASLADAALGTEAERGLDACGSVNSEWGGTRADLAPISKSALSSLNDAGDSNDLITRDSDTLDLFIKLFNPLQGLTGLLRIWRRMPALRVVRITGQLRARAFLTPRLLLLADEPRSGRSLLIAARAQGELLPSAISRAAAESPARKWALLRSLGHEIARLHRAGFVHGDLTPYNVLVIDEAAGRFVLLDHDRTCLPLLLRRRRQLRNLVQLGRPQFNFLSKTDRLRFYAAYAKARGVEKDSRMLRRVNAMLNARRRRDLRRAASDVCT
jgi:hypothetical protein